MAELDLQGYSHQIEGMIERSAYDEAIAHCRHVLQQHPKYIEPYRLIGKAALDREDNQQASDMFARVLSADPSDFLSRAGLAIIYDRQGSLQDAVWQMERAYELEPGNPVIQDELRKLYARRDGVVPEKIPLTRGALARLYINGELYPEAVAELRALLAQEPDRVDLQVLLAEALWRDEQRLEASDVALKVLDRLPYCLDANLILGEIWMSGGREEDAEVHLKRARMLDPEAIRARQLFGKVSPIPSQPVEIVQLEYALPTSPEQVVEQVPEWLTSVGTPAEAGGEEIPAWLQGIGLPESGEAVAEVPVTEAVTPPGLVEPAEEVPAWLTGITAPTAPAEAPAAEVPEWLAQLPAGEIPSAEAEVEAAPVEAPAAEEVEIPDWLRALRPAEALAPSVEEAEGMPDWLAQVRAEVPPVPGAEAQAVAEETLEPSEIPEWLQALRAQTAEAPVPSEELVSEAPDWLAQLHAEAGPVYGAEEAQVVEAPEVTEEVEMPDWLQALRSQEAEAAPVTEGEWPAAVPPQAVEARPVEAAPIAPEAETPSAAPSAEPITPPSVPVVVPTPVEGKAPLPPIEEAPAWMKEGGGMPTPEEAMAFFAKLTAGREAELQAQAQAEAEARMTEIIGRESAAAPQVKVGAPPPVPIQVPAPPAVEAVAPAPPVEAVTPPPSPAVVPAPPAVEVQVEVFEPMAAQPKIEKVEEAPVEAIPYGVAVPAQPPVVEALPVKEAMLPVTPVEAPIPAVPVAMPRTPVAPAAVGPEWWYQTLADEEGPVEELVPEQVVPITEAVPVVAATPEVAPALVVAPPPEPVPAAPVLEAGAPVEPKPVVTRRLVRAKPAPPTPPKPAVDMDAIMARLRADPDDPQALKEMARGWVQLGNMNAARNGYEELIRRGATLDDVISDLETMIEDHPDDVDSTRLLGDAHMKAGNLRKALKLYRQALKRL